MDRRPRALLIEDLAETFAGPDAGMRAAPLVVDRVPTPAAAPPHPPDAYTAILLGPHAAGQETALSDLRLRYPSLPIYALIPPAPQGEELRAVFDGLLDALLIVGISSRTILCANAATRHILGHDPAHLVGRSFPSLFAGQETAPDPLFAEAVRLRGGVLEAQAFQHADGSVSRLDMTVAVIGWQGDVALLVSLRDSSDRERTERRLAHRASHDPLTDLPNRFLFEDRSVQAVAQANRSGEGVAIHLVDLDDFKGVNDTLGHPAGDALLRQVARRLCTVVRRSDTVARLGGDEFAVIQRQVGSERAARTLAEKLVAVLEAPPFTIAGHTVAASASVGVALHAAGLDAEELVGRADAALYCAKEDGRGRVRVFGATEATAARIPASTRPDAALPQRAPP